MENLLKIGLLLILIGFIIVFASSFTSKSPNVKAAGGIFIGPFPIFGAFTNKKSFYLILILAIILFFIFSFFNR
ncbi:DUF131 domain-containing protein [Candidatus Woesearchaeota archaeon]|nr:DUF131 domain-containing protein [Candidatus Woesearchaeota archaeon]